MDHEQQQILDLLRERGPLTVEQIAEALYPSGQGFREDWGLSAEGKVEMELDRLGFAVEAITPGLWVVTTPERAAELRRTARALAASELRALRRKRAAGTITNGELMRLYVHLDGLRDRREVNRRSRLSIAERVAEFNDSLRAAQRAVQEHLDWYNAPAVRK